MNISMGGVIPNQVANAADSSGIAPDVTKTGTQITGTIPFTTTIYTWTAVDKAGNTAECTTTYKVIGKPTSKLLWRRVFRLPTVLASLQNWTD